LSQGGIVQERLWMKKLVYCYTSFFNTKTTQPGWFRLECLQHASTSCFIIIVWVSSFSPLLSPLHLRTGLDQPINCLIIQNRQAVLHVEVDGMDIGRQRWSMVWSSVPHSQAAKEAIPHLCKQEQKRQTPVRRRLSRTHAILGRVIPGGWMPVSGMKVRSLVGVHLSSHSTFHRWSGQCAAPLLLSSEEMINSCAARTWVSQFETPFICTRWTRALSGAGVHTPWPSVLETVWLLYGKAQQVWWPWGCKRCRCWK